MPSQVAPSSAPLNDEPSDPQERIANDLTPKSYAQAVETEINDDLKDAGPFTYTGEGEDDTPRSPTRKPHRRDGSMSQSHHRRGSSMAEVANGLKKPVDGKNEEKPTYAEVVEENNGSSNGDRAHLTSLDRPGYEKELQQAEKEEEADDATKEERKAKAGQPRGTLVSGRRAGAGWDNSGQVDFSLRWAPLNIPLKRRLQTFVVLLHILSIVSLLTLFFFLCAIPLFWPVLLPYLVYVLFSNAGTSGTLSHRSEWLRRAPIWSLFASYFPARLHRSQELPPTRKYIFGYHPHGIISLGVFAAFATEALGFSTLFPGLTNTLLTLDSNFRIPLYRDYALLMGIASVSRESCENLLSRGGPNNEGMGRAITIVVGGARESLDAHPGTLRLVLGRRLGFVKLAIRTGADLVPVLGFGENDLYDQLGASQLPLVHKAQLLVKKLLGFTVPLFHARGVFNYDVGMMPYRRPVNVVVGRPIMVNQQGRDGGKLDEKYVEEIHARYVDELKRLWDQWKDEFAPARKEDLVVVE
ncbi:MAG: hypothetical protein M1819_002288 [Sarea resinae]|nr:MAG: hypothetical protein M1819_002288 [Sarea resinae]